MGIAGLLMFLKSKNPKIVQSMSSDDIKGMSIAFDLPILVYQKKSSVIRNQVKGLQDPIYDDPNYYESRILMVKYILDDIGAFMELNIKPVMVFDGKAPALKDGTKAMRKGKSTDKKHIISELRRIAKDVLENSGKNISSSDIEWLREFKKPCSSIDDLRTLIRNQLNQYVVVGPDDYILLRTIFKSLGVPVVQAVSEAEQTCSLMCKRKDVVAIYTTDSDCLVYGCPIMIKSYKIQKKARIAKPIQFECYTFKNALDVLGLKQQEFVDFCIMMGTDFNGNVAGYGPSKNYDFIKCYKSIIKIAEARNKIKNKSVREMSKWEILLMNYDVTKLNYLEVRDFFCENISYNREDLEITVTTDQFEATTKLLSGILDDKSLLAISSACRKISTYILQLKTK